MIKSVLPLLALALIFAVFFMARPDDLYAQQSQVGTVASEEAPPPARLPGRAKYTNIVLKRGVDTAR